MAPIFILLAALSFFGAADIMGGSPTRAATCPVDDIMGGSPTLRASAGAATGGGPIGR